MTWTTSLATVASITLIGSAALAQDVRITTFRDDSTFTLNGRTFTVARNPDTTATVPDDYALTSRACPPNCVQPMVAADGVATIAELEVLDFLEDVVTGGGGLLIDTRATAAFGADTIPGAVNVPQVTLEAENRYRADILRALGAVDTADGGLDFTNALSLVLFAGGPWSPDATQSVKLLVDAGYPADKLSFYRGGMQAWVQLGLTTLQTQTPG